MFGIDPSLIAPTVVSGMFLIASLWLTRILSRSDKKFDQDKHRRDEQMDEIRMLREELHRYETRYAEAAAAVDEWKDKYYDCKRDYLSKMMDALRKANNELH